MRLIPIILSVSRLPLGVVVLVLAIHGLWVGASIVLVIAALTDLFDGMVARRLKVTSDLGRYYLDPFSDLALTVLALAGLLVTGLWSWWILIPIAIVGGGLQLIAVLPMKDDSVVVRKMKVIQFRVLPFAYLFLLLSVGAAYCYMSAGRGTFGIIAISALVLGAISVGIFRRDRVIAFATGNY